MIYKKVYSLALAILFSIAGQLYAFSSYASKTIVGITGVALSCLAYKNQKSLNQKLAQYKERAQDCMISHIIAPVIVKWEDIKEEGLAKSDVATLATLLVSPFLVMKLYKNFNFRDHTADIIKMLCRRINAHFYKSLTALFAAVLITSFYKSYRCVQSNRAYFYSLDHFLALLTPEQKEKIINSNELVQLLDQASYNPQILKQDNILMTLLDEQQRDCLDNLTSLY